MADNMSFIPIKVNVNSTIYHLAPDEEITLMSNKYCRIVRKRYPLCGNWGNMNFMVSNLGRACKRCNSLASTYEVKTRTSGIECASHGEVRKPCTPSQ